jgi:hypothetical protein
MNDQQQAFEFARKQYNEWLLKGGKVVVVQPTGEIWVEFDKPPSMADDLFALSVPLALTMYALFLWVRRRRKPKLS